MSLFSEGQLDQSTLTLKDLHAITKSFVRALQGMLHTRIEYPKETETQEKIKWRYSHIDNRQTRISIKEEELRKKTEQILGRFGL